MARARKESIFHLILLLLVQIISLAVVVLNATALYLSQNSQHTFGVVKVYSTPADYMLLILGSVSFLVSTIYLLLHIRIYFRIVEDYPFSPPKSLSASQVVLSVISIASWTVATSVILTHSQQSASPCKITNYIYIYDHNAICELFNTALILAFASVGSWVLVLLATLIILVRSPIPPTTIFTIEAPPQKFSQPKLISPPNEAYIQSTKSSPYFLDYQNKIYPEQEMVFKVENTIENNKRNHMTDVGNSDILLSQNLNPRCVGHEHDPRYTGYYYEHQSQYKPLLSPSNNISSATSNTMASSYHSARHIPHSDTMQSISSIESSYKTGFQSLNIDLPVIHVGALSRIDVSFLEKK